MNIGLQIPSFKYPGGTAAIRPKLKEIVTTAESAGFYSLWVMDHYYQIKDLFGETYTDPMMESYTTLGYFAGLTEKAYLGVLVTGVIYRHPAVLMKMVNTLDILSAGRAYFGIGAAWYEAEAKGYGIPYPSTSKRFEMLEKVDTPTIFFFLGILSAVAALQSAGQLTILAGYLDDKLGNIFLIDMAIGVLSAVVDNVPLVAGAMGMYPIEDAASIAAMTDPASIEYASNFIQDGLFWEFLAYCAGTGGSILIIGSAAGVAAMGMEKIDFIWYLKRISLLALLGYVAGAGVYYLQALLLHH